MAYQKTAGGGGTTEEAGSRLLEEAILPTWLNQRAVTFCDYYVFRRRRLNVPDLYRTDGQFRYWHGINPAGVISWFVAALVALVWLDIAFLLGFPIAFVLYYVLMRFWVLPRYAQAEIESGFDDRYLATSLGLNWVYHRGEGFTREKTEEIPESAVKREDL